MRIALNEQTRNNIIWLCGLCLVGFVAFWPDAQLLELKRVFRGWSPVDYVNHLLAPEFFSKDWHTGIKDAYRFSLPMQFFLWSEKYLEIEAEKLLAPYAWIQWFFFLGSVAFLSWVLFRDKLITFVCLVVVATSTLVGMNIANFGHGYSRYNPYLYYTFANGFRIAALAFLLNRNYHKAAIFFGIGFYCHIIMAFAGVCFAYFYALFDKQLFQKKVFLRSMLLLGVITLPAVLPPILYSSLPKEMALPDEQWVFVMRLLNYHWFPIGLGYLDKMIWKYTIPMLYLLGLFYFSWRYFLTNGDRQVHKKVFFGMLAIIILTIMGLIFSEVSQTPFLIRLSLHRTSDLLTFMSMLYIVGWLVAQLKQGNIVILPFILAALFSFIYFRPGIALLPILSAMLISNFKNPFLNKPDRILLWLFFGLIIIQCLYISTHFNFWVGGKWYRHIDADSTQWAILVSIVFMLLLSALAKLKPQYKQVNYTVLCLILTGMLFHESTAQQNYWKDRHGAKAESIKEVQVWLNENTPKDSLISANPTHSKGWREYSQRSYFGSMQEWIGTPFLYVAKKSTFNEGVSRLKAFGIDLNEITEEKVKQSNKNLYIKELFIMMRNNFSKFREEDFLHFHKVFGINYLVLEKKHWENKLTNFQNVFENDQYYVFHLDKEANNYN